MVKAELHVLVVRARTVCLLACSPEEMCTFLRAMVLANTDNLPRAAAQYRECFMHSGNLSAIKNVLRVTNNSSADAVRSRLAELPSPAAGSLVAELICQYGPQSLY